MWVATAFHYFVGPKTEHLWVWDFKSDTSKWRCSFECGETAMDMFFYVAVFPLSFTVIIFIVPSSFFLFVSLQQLKAAKPSQGRSFLDSCPAVGFIQQDCLSLVLQEKVHQTRWKFPPITTRLMIYLSIMLYFKCSAFVKCSDTFSKRTLQILS